MGIREALRGPGPVPVRISSRASGQRFAAALASAIAERRSSERHGNDVLLRLRDGSVTTSEARFRVKTYVVPGIRARDIDKVVVGSFKDTLLGSEFTGLASVPIGHWSIRILVSWTALIATFFALFVGGIAMNRLSDAGESPLFSLVVAILAACWQWP